MKKFAIIAMCFVLCLGLMTACRGNSADETAPSTSTSTQSTTAPTTATTSPSTAPTTQSTAPSNEGTIDGNGDAAGEGGKVGRLPYRSGICLAYIIIESLRIFVNSS